MFTIRSQQVEAMSRALEEDFVARMVVHLRSEFGEMLADRGLREDDLKSFVRRGLESARPFEVLAEDDVRRYLDCMVVLGADFDRTVTWAAAILRDDERDGTQKMDAILDALPFAEEST